MNIQMDIFLNSTEHFRLLTRLVWPDWQSWALAVILKLFKIKLILKLCLKFYCFLKLYLF